MKRRQYSEDFKREAVRLALEPGQTKAQVARDLDLSESVLFRWVERYGATPNGKGAAVTGDERAELVQLRRRVKTLEMEQEVLKKAITYFGRDLR